MNQVDFLLQWGYFVVCGRFFHSHTFAPADVIQVARLLSVNPLLVNLHQYNRKTIFRHRQAIRQELGFTAFAGPGKAMARGEVNQLVSRHIGIINEDTAPDAEVGLRMNLDGLKQELKALGDSAALKTYP